MTTIEVRTLQEPYPIYIGSDYLSRSSLFKSYLSGDQLLIVSSPDIAEHYLSVLLAALRQLGNLQIDTFLVPKGETHKTLHYAEKIWTMLLEKKHYRDTTIIALGGGMIGDLAGFCAACYMRGVKVIQCPTTLLAQIDAAIGGKVGVNHPLAKNVIGAFHAPCAVIADIRTLDSLPTREYIAGIAEMIKYGLALEADFFQWLIENMPAILSKEPIVLAEAIKKSVYLKVQIVEKDEKEKNLRMLLNFGHTLGHSLESILSYDSLLHGEAVALGMIAAVHLSIQKGGLDKRCLQTITDLFEYVGLPTSIPANISAKALMAKMEQDKKHLQKNLRFVLLAEIGQAYIDESVTKSEILSTLRACGAQG